MYKQIWFTHTVEYNSAIGTTTMRINLEYIMLLDKPTYTKFQKSQTIVTKNKSLFAQDQEFSEGINCKQTENKFLE